MSVLKAIDLFAGAGGLTVGLGQAGFRVVGAVENSKLACDTYADNHPKVHLWRQDIRELDGAEVLRVLALERGQLDLLAGCPPCQGFSSIRTLNGARLVTEPRNDLLTEYARLVKELLPKAILMENVPGLAQDQRMVELVDLLEDLGYPAREAAQVLNAADYGVPQSRRRLVLVATRVGPLDPVTPLPRRSTVRDAIGHLEAPGSTGDPLHDLPERRSARISALIRRVPADGGSRLDLDEQLQCHEGFSGFKDVYGRMAWDRPAPTITGGCHNPSKGRFIHPDQHRAITLREAALLQGFPADYTFRLDRGKLAAAVMIGNALPPGFVAAHARPVAKRLRAAHRHRSSTTVTP